MKNQFNKFLCCIVYTNKSSPTLNCRHSRVIKIRFTNEIKVFVYLYRTLICTHVVEFSVSLIVLVVHNIFKLVLHIKFDDNYHYNFVM